MIGLLQRVSRAHIEVDQQLIAQIGNGIVALIGVERSDTQTKAEKLLHRILNYRLFPDHEGKMNLALKDTGGELLLIPQFTLAAETNKGLRPSFSSAASPEQGQPLFNYLLARAGSGHTGVQSGIFGADMKVSLTNDGPVTFWLQV